MSFGFAVGDFLAVIELVHDLAVALSGSHGSGSKFKGLIQELYSIERVMVEIKSLQTPVVLESNLGMIQQAALQCQAAITDFLQRNDGYMHHLGQTGSNRWWKGAFFKIKWAVYKTDEVEELRACLRSHSIAMSLMLQILQM